MIVTTIPDPNSFAPVNSDLRDPDFLIMPRRKPEAEIPQMPMNFPIFALPYGTHLDARHNSLVRSCMHIDQK